MNKTILNVLMGFLGGLSAALLCFFIARPPEIATVDINALVRPEIMRLAKAKLTQAEKKLFSHDYEILLHQTLAAYSRKHHLILLSKPALIAGVGVRDLTSELNSVLTQGEE